MARTSWKRAREIPSNKDAVHRTSQMASASASLRGAVCLRCHAVVIVLPQARSAMPQSQRNLSCFSRRVGTESVLRTGSPSAETPSLEPRASGCTRPLDIRIAIPPNRQPGSTIRCQFAVSGASAYWGPWLMTPGRASIPLSPAPRIRIAGALQGALKPEIPSLKANPRKF